jgi:ribosomal protein S18 acetylase RimI-like enzyme
VDDLRATAVPGPHWYLAGIGVDPSEQRRGIGSALLAPGIEGSERARVPCALLTNSEGNLSFYRRHGFEVVLEGETPTDGPHAWMMLRKPNS